MKVLMVLFLSSLAVHAQNNRISQIQKLEKEFSSLKYDQREDRQLGYKKVPEALRLMQDFITGKTRGKERVNEFRALVSLVAAALPYDQATDTAGTMLVLIESDRKLRQEYEDALKSVKDSCHERLLRTTVESRQCLENLDERRSGTECANRFNFESCKGVPELRK